MLAFMALQTVNRLQRTERETVRQFAPAAAAEPEHVVTAYVGAAIADAFNMRGLPNTIVIEDIEPAAVPSDRSASAEFDRKAFIAVLRTAAKQKSYNRFCILNLSADSADVTTVHCETLHKQDVRTLNNAGESVSVCIPDSKLVQVLSKLKTNYVKIVATIDSTDDSATVRIESDGGQFTLPAEDSERWEPRPQVLGADGKWIDMGKRQPVQEMLEIHRKAFSATFGTIVSAGELQKAIQRTQYATDTASTRYALGGVLFEQETAERLTIVATDSRRLAIRSMNAETAGTFPDDDCDRKPFVVNSEALKLLVDSLGRLHDDAPVMIAAAGNDFVFEVEHEFSIRSRQVEGRFPRYRDVVPRNGFNIVATFQKLALHSAIETAAVVCSEESRGMDFTFDDEMLVIRGESSEFGKSKTSLNALPSSARCRSTWDGCHTITFDPSYVMDYLKTTKSERVTIKLIDGNTAAVIEDEDNSDGLCVIMPLSQDR